MCTHYNNDKNLKDIYLRQMCNKDYQGFLPKNNIDEMFRDSQNNSKCQSWDFKHENQSAAI